MRSISSKKKKKKKKKMPTILNEFKIGAIAYAIKNRRNRSFSAVAREFKASPTTVREIVIMDKAIVQARAAKSASPRQNDRKRSCVSVALFVWQE